MAGLLDLCPKCAKLDFWIFFGLSIELIETNNNICTVQSESSKFASQIVPGFVVYYLNIKRLHNIMYQSTNVSCNH